jgi:hypothetical protein
MDMNEVWALLREESRSSNLTNTESSQTDGSTKTEQGVEKPETPKLLEQVRRVMRVAHYSIRTEEAYTDWIRRFSSRPIES